MGLSMDRRPYTLLSCGVSLDGYLDAATDERLLLSNEADLDRVDAVRAGCDAILVGAATVRNDNPRLLVRSRTRQDERVARGLCPTPMKVTVTATADLDACASFFAAGDTDKLVYCVDGSVARARERLGCLATIVDGGPHIDMGWLSEDLYDRGVRRLMVEGGGTLHTQFLTSGLADELHLVVAPLFVGDSKARRFVSDGAFPWNPDRRATLAEVRRIDDVVLLRYALSDRFRMD
jgi:5-amino-6-(5-phosphoribosylamino)uracil reductase